VQTAWTDELFWRAAPGRWERAAAPQPAAHSTTGTSRSQDAAEPGRTRRGRSPPPQKTTRNPHRNLGGVDRGGRGPVAPGSRPPGVAYREPGLRPHRNLGGVQRGGVQRGGVQRGGVQRGQVERAKSPGTAEVGEPPKKYLNHARSRVTVLFLFDDSVYGANTDYLVRTPGFAGRRHLARYRGL
jgi:hypothetical protein